MIFQELSYVPDQTLEENLFLGRWPKRGGHIDWKTVRATTMELLRQGDPSYAPDTKLRSPSVLDIQMLEILKAISYDAKIVIMDEPTSAITNREVEKLFRKIEELKARGASISYISHKMDEIFRIADEITNQYPKCETTPGDEILRVERFTQPGVFEDISFLVRRGEIVGFAGLMGAGRTEVMRVLFGLAPIRRGACRSRARTRRSATSARASKRAWSCRQRTGAVPASLPF